MKYADWINYDFLNFLYRIRQSINSFSTKMHD